MASIDSSHEYVSFVMDGMTFEYAIKFRWK